MTEEASQPKGDVITTEFVAVRKRAASKPADLPSQVRAMRAIARDNYAVARISLVCGYPISGCLLAHQAVEMYLKGIISANGGKASGHNLRELVGHGATRFAGGDWSCRKERRGRTVEAKCMNRRTGYSVLSPRTQPCPLAEEHEVALRPSSATRLPTALDLKDADCPLVLESTYLASSVWPRTKTR